MKENQIYADMINQDSTQTLKVSSNLEFGKKVELIKHISSASQKLENKSFLNSIIENRNSTLQVLFQKK